MKTAPISFRIEPDLKAALEQCAKNDSRSLSAYIELVLKQHIAGKKRKPK